MPVQIRFRNDSSYIADSKIEQPERVMPGQHEGWCTPERWAETPAAAPGDCWRVRWGLSKEQIAAGMTEGPIAGYVICCIKCKRCHWWTGATNCGSKKERTGTNPDGSSFTYTACDHSGTGSCWGWTGSAEDGTLTASPSLHCQADLGGCGYHGWLQNGILSDG